MHDGAKAPGAGPTHGPTSDRGETASQVGEDAMQSRARFSMGRIVLVMVVLVLGVAGLLWTGLPVPSMQGGGRVTLHEAHVFGAVAHLGSADDGRIASLHVDLGDTVAAGDLLAALDDAAQTRAVAAAEHRLGRLRADLARARIADDLAAREAEAALTEARRARDADIAQLDAAQADLDLEREQFARVSELVARGAQTEADLERAREARRAARAAVTRREAELDASRAAVRDARIRADRDTLRAADRDVLRARIAEAEARLAGARAALARTRIVADAGGVVVGVEARAGASVRPGDTILSVWKRDETWLRALASERLAARLDVGDTARVRIDALKDATFAGTVRRVLVSRTGGPEQSPGRPVSPLLPDETRFAVRIDFDADAEALARLLPGMSGEARVRTGDGARGAAGLPAALFDALARTAEETFGFLGL